MYNVNVNGWYYIVIGYTCKLPAGGLCIGICVCQQVIGVLLYTYMSNMGFVLFVVGIVRYQGQVFPKNTYCECIIVCGILIISWIFVKLKPRK